MKLFVGHVVGFDDVRCTDLDLVDVNLSILFLQLLVSLLHSIDGGHSVAKILRRKGSRLHIKCLLDQLRKLRLVHPLLLQRPQCTLLYGILYHPVDKPSGGAANQR